jgi:hypothetical protein
VLNVFGTGLALELVNGPLFDYWLLHGTLQDGTPIAEPAIILRFDNSVVNLHEIPEPSGVVLAGLGFAGIVVWRRRRTRPVLGPC